MINKVISWPTRLLAVVATLLVVYLMTTGLAVVKVNQTHQLAENVIKEVKHSTHSDTLKLGIEVMEATGVERAYIASLPKQVSLGFSLGDLYRLSVRYDQNGRISQQDLGLTHRNDLQRILNQVLVLELNRSIENDRSTAYHALNAYRYSFVFLLVLYLLAMVLFLLGRKIAVLPLLLATGGYFSALCYFQTSFNQSVHHTFLQPMQVFLQPQVYLSLSLSVILGVSWFGWCYSQQKRLLRSKQ